MFSKQLNGKCQLNWTLIGGSTRIRKAFTLIELLVVISIIAILLSILLPSLRLAKAKAIELLSLSNMKSLTLAWLLYEENSNGKLVCGQVWYNYDIATNQKDEPPNGIQQHDWVHPYIDSTDPFFRTGMSDHERELAGIRKGALWPYVEEEDVYHSPGDRNWKKGVSTYSAMTSPYRSYAISDTMNGLWRFNYSYRKFTDIKNPSKRMVFTEEEDQNGANFGSWCLGNPGTHSWWDPLAAWYNKGSSSIFGFADGHADKHVWQDQNTKDWIKSQQLDYTPPIDERDDILYMESIYRHNY